MVVFKGRRTMFENHQQPLLSRRDFLRRQARYTLIASVVVIGSLLIGVLGYHFLESLSWVDAFVNASMILGGMGPVNPLHTDAGKVFAGFYALYSGLIFLVVAAILIAPALHRFLHNLHIESDSDNS
jgi:hypothetical protein